MSTNTSFAWIVPFTSNLYEGLSVPIPTLPLLVSLVIYNVIIYNFAVANLYKREEGSYLLYSHLLAGDYHYSHKK